MAIRPSWCPRQDDCDPVYSGFDRTCLGRLREIARHDDLMNTHNLCLDCGDISLEVNDEDLWILGKTAAAGRKDVADNGLYRPPGWGEEWAMGEK